MFKIPFSSSSNSCAAPLLQPVVIHWSAFTHTLGHLSQRSVKVETSPTIHLPVYWHRKTRFYALARDLWAATAASGCVCVHSWVHVVVTCAHLSLRKDQVDVLIDTSPPSLSHPCPRPLSPPANRPSLNLSLSFKSLLGNPIPFISTERLAF